VILKRARISVIYYKQF